MIYPSTLEAVQPTQMLLPVTLLTPLVILLVKQ
jgi:hypothetical protein